MSILAKQLLLILCVSTTNLRVDALSCYQNEALTFGSFKRENFKPALCTDSSATACVLVQGKISSDQPLLSSTGNFVFGECASNINSCNSLTCTNYASRVRSIVSFVRLVNDNTCSVRCCQTDNCNSVSASPAPVTPATPRAPAGVGFVGQPALNPGLAFSLPLGFLPQLQPISLPPPQRIRPALPPAFILTTPFLPVIRTLASVKPAINTSPPIKSSVNLSPSLPTRVTSVVPVSSNSTAMPGLSCYQNENLFLNLFNRTKFSSGPCPASSACMRLSGKIVPKVPAFLVRGNVIYGECVPAINCSSLTCSDYAKKIAALQFAVQLVNDASCSVTCCHTSNCNKNQTPHPTSPVTTSHDTSPVTTSHVTSPVTTSHVTSPVTTSHVTTKPLSLPNTTSGAPAAGVHQVLCFIALIAASIAGIFILY